MSSVSQICAAVPNTGSQHVFDICNQVLKFYDLLVFVRDHPVGEPLETGTKNLNTKLSKIS